MKLDLFGLSQMKAVQLILGIKQCHLVINVQSQVLIKTLLLMETKASSLLQPRPILGRKPAKELGHG